MNAYELIISPSLKYTFLKFTCSSDGMISADLEEHVAVWNSSWTYNNSLHFAGNNKGADFWIPAIEAERPELGHMDEHVHRKIADWLKEVWKDLVQK